MMMEKQVSNRQLAINQMFLWFVLMVTSVCGESRTSLIGGGENSDKESTYPYF